MLVGALTGGRAAIDPLKASAGSKVGAMPVESDVEIEFDSALRATVKARVRLPFLEALQRACGSFCQTVTAN